MRSEDKKRSRPPTPYDDKSNQDEERPSKAMKKHDDSPGRSGCTSHIGSNTGNAKPDNEFQIESESEPELFIKKKKKKKSEPEPEILPHTPPHQTTNHQKTTGSVTRPTRTDMVGASNIYFPGISSRGNRAIKVNFEKGNGNYTLQLTSVTVENTIEEKAHTAALLFSQADVLRELGDHLLSQIRASVQSECYKSLNI